MPKLKHTSSLPGYIIYICLCCCFPILSHAQIQPGHSTKKDLQRIQSTNNTADIFIENIGQYGKTISGFEAMGDIRFGYEGFGMPVLFTPKGTIHLQRKISRLTHREEEKLEEQGLSEEEIEVKRNVTDRAISMEWEGASTTVDLIMEDQARAYHTYGMLMGKAQGYKKIIYKNIYPGIDIVYSLSSANRLGFEYSIYAMPGADLGRLKMKIAGDVAKIKKDKEGNLVIRSDIDGIAVSVPICFYADSAAAKKNPVPKAFFAVEGNAISLEWPEGYDRQQAIVVDPFVTATGNLTGVNAGKAKDVDFDYAGNIYITGGGDGNLAHRLAKYDASGVLQWTFSGTLTIPSWSFGSYWGGWMVEKPTGNIYLGQGFNPTTGFQVVRINTTGLYDNYITTANPNFREAWKMYWSCNNGSPQILVAGGGTNSAINFGVFVPPSTNIGSLNVTGIPYTGSAGWAQDIVDFIIDPANNDMYTIYGSLIGNPSLTNQVYKNAAPYSGASVAWNVPSGFISVQEIQNRPYLLGGPIDNSANIFAINRFNLFYWDGKNLKAFDKATGNTVGTPLVTPNTTLMQGGISADDCNNIFVGNGNGVIKVYKFNGATFDDAAAPDITIPGYGGRAVYDLAYDESKKLLYASGDGFVASFDVAGYCPTTQYTLAVVANCITSSAAVTVNPAPPAGANITYTLYNGAAQIATNTTGIFTGLMNGTTYAVIATINLACSGTQASLNFVLPGPTVSTTQVNTTCSMANGSINATGSGTAGPYTYSIDGITFQAGGSFSNLAAGVYTIIVNDANGCKQIKQVIILNTNGPQLNYISSNADCGSNNGTITVNATGGTAPYQYSINGITYQAGNFFTGLTGGTYTITVKDASGCTNAVVVAITSSPAPMLTAIPATATCGSNNGTITAFGSGGTAPLQYSINGNTYQPANIFSGVTPGVYTVYVKDVNGCIQTVIVNVANAAGPTVTAVSTAAACSNVNGTITVTGTGGVAPLQYSINGVAFQSGNNFSGLAAGTYTITVKDITGCTNTVNVTVSSTGGPTVNAASINSTCNASNGIATITAVGTAPFQYSINGGLTFQLSNIFTGLASGNYIVLVRDAAGCISAVSVTVGAVAGPSLTALSTAASCTVNNGTIAATGTGGTAPLQYSIDGITFQAGNIFSSLAPGTYTITVKDAIGCLKAITVYVANASGLTLSVSDIISSCTGNTGIITATATGGVVPLQYSINGFTYQAGNVFSALASGTYTVYVKDANNCIVSQQVVVAAAAGPSIAVNTVDATCGSANAIIIAAGAGGVVPLTYSIDGITFQSSGTFIDIAPGTYTVIVKDANGCTASQVVSISNIGAGPGIATFTVVTNGAYPCNSVLGKITNPRVNGANCNGCTFSLNGGPFVPNATQLFLNLAPGTYMVTAMDANGCTKTIFATIGNATLATVTATVTGSNCNTSTGTITLTGVGPNTPYHVSITGISGPWITFDPTYTFTGLAPGVYTIISSDDESFDSGPPIDPGGCLDTVTVIVPSIGGPAIIVSNTPGSCGDDNGTITVNASGGLAPYDYSIDGTSYQPSNIFTGLPSGIYFVSVTDANGCIAVKRDTLTNGLLPTLNAVNTTTTCGSNNGVISITASGGTAPYQYSINGTTFQSSNIFSGLTAGNYTVYLKDVNACYSTANLTITSTPRPSVIAYTVAASCNAADGMVVATGSSGIAPYQFSINGTVFQSSNLFTGLAAGFYTITIKDDSGCLNTTGVSIGNNNGPAITGTVTSASTCGNANGSISVTATGGVAPYQYSINAVIFQPSNIFASLLAGTYTITVKDNNGCLGTKTLLVANVNGPQLLNATIIHAACGLANGTITASGSGGTGALQYSINGIVYQAGPVFNLLLAGPYTLYVKDANGCIKTLPVTLQNLNGPTLSASSAAASCTASDGSITAFATGGTGILTYSIDGLTFQASHVFTALAPGPYTVTVKDARGCTATFNISVPVIGSTITPTFNPVAAICSGAALAALPTTSLNGITGIWLPALNNTTTTTYTFTPTAGQCATTATLTITVTPNVTPTFTAVAAICSGAALAALPTTSLNGITGTWLPALNNTTTTTYTFTPTAGQCATTASLPITVNSILTATINCGVSTTSTITFNWTNVVGATGYTISYQVGLNPVVNVGSIGNLLTYQVTGLSAGDNVSITVTATGPAGTCFASSTTNCTAVSCTPPTASISYAGPFCSALITAQAVNLAGTGAYTGGVYSSTAGLSINSITGAIDPSSSIASTYTVSYILPGTGGCSGVTATTSVTVLAQILPTFNPVAAICSGTALASLPTTSLNGITGTWLPALNNTTTTTYTFTPTAGQCATTATLTITVTPNVTPTFTPVAAICSGAALAALPTTSLNGITGTWLPALNNTTTTIYTFTPTAGQCATTATLTITVTPNVTPTFTAVAAICSGAALAALPTTSLNGITGIWLPALNNTTTTTYTFTPTAGQCATTATSTITVNPILTPVINCGPSTTGSVIFNWNAVTGATGYSITYQVGLNPVVNVGAIGNVITYQVTGLTGGDNVSITITPTGLAGTCFATSSAICSAVACPPPTFNSVAPICSGATLAALPTSSLNGINGTWSPALNNTTTTTYTFTPTGGQCTTTATLMITVTPNVTPTFTAVAAICSGAALTALPTTSLNGINGTWSPTLNNTTTTTYTFTPAGGQCAAHAIQTILINPLPATPNLLFVQPTCTVPTGTAMISSPTSSINFSLDGAAFASYPFGGYSNISPGLHNLVSQSASGCNAVAVSFTINVVPLAPTAIAFTTNPASCGNSNAVLTLGAVTGGIAPYRYSVDASAFTATLIYPGLPAGTHSIVVKDINGCSFSTSATIIAISGPTVTAIAVNTGCGVLTGSITATGTGGTLPYRYSINGTSFQQGNSFTGLAANTYTITIRDANNCSNTTTVIVGIDNAVTLSAGATATVCEGESTILNAVTNAANVAWSPITGLSNAGIPNPVASPVFTTEYVITVTTGLCSKKDSVKVLVNPAPTAHAGNDAQVCNGKILQLQGSGGIGYQWQPATYLSNPGIANPVLQSASAGNYQYLLTITDANGCRSLKPDTLLVTVLPVVAVFAGNDTAIAINQPLQLNAIDLNHSGIIGYIWSPSFGLSNAGISNPVATISYDITYVVTGRDANNCVGWDDIHIKVYLGPEIYVPTAFTPNADGLNDIFKPILIGIRELRSFAVYNRYGEQVYQTSDQGEGWNGVFKGQPQNAGAFIWVAEAVDYKGNVLRRKGTVVLVR